MTKEAWKLLSKKSQWDILVGLRGPDIRNSEVVKNFTTGVIRRAMSTVIRVGGQLSDLNFVVIPTGPVFKGEMVDLDHFALHTREAAENLGVPVVWVEGPIWENLVYFPSRTGSMKALYKYLKATGDVNNYSLAIKNLEEVYGFSDESLKSKPSSSGATKYPPKHWASMSTPSGPSSDLLKGHFLDDPPTEHYPEGDDDSSEEQDE